VKTSKANHTFLGRILMSKFCRGSWIPVAEMTGYPEFDNPEFDP